MYYDKEGNKITRDEWVELFDNDEYRRIGLTEVESGKVISTVWLGLDHNFGLGSLMMFETLVFQEQGYFGDEECHRYSTLDQAIEGHNEVVNRLRGVQDKSSNLLEVKSENN